MPWELNAVTPQANVAKGSSDPAKWLPPLSSDLCPYVEAWIGTKVRWALAVDTAEKAALEIAIAECPGSAIVIRAVAE